MPLGVPKHTARILLAADNTPFGLSRELASNQVLTCPHDHLDLTNVNVAPSSRRQLGIWLYKRSITVEGAATRLVPDVILLGNLVYQDLHMPAQSSNKANSYQIDTPSPLPSKQCSGSLTLP